MSACGSIGISVEHGMLGRPLWRLLEALAFVGNRCHSHSWLSSVGLSSHRLCRAVLDSRRFTPGLPCPPLGDQLFWRPLRCSMPRMSIGLRETQEEAEPSCVRFLGHLPCGIRITKLGARKSVSCFTELSLELVDSAAHGSRYMLRANSQLRCAWKCLEGRLSLSRIRHTIVALEHARLSMFMAMVSRAGRPRPISAQRCALVISEYPSPFWHKQHPAGLPGQFELALSMGGKRSRDVNSEAPAAKKSRGSNNKLSGDGGLFGAAKTKRKAQCERCGAHGCDVQVVLSKHSQIGEARSGTPSNFGAYFKFRTRLHGHVRSSQLFRVRGHTKFNHGVHVLLLLVICGALFLVLSRPRWSPSPSKGLTATPRVSGPASGRR